MRSTQLELGTDPRPWQRLRIMQEQPLQVRVRLKPYGDLARRSPSEEEQLQKVTKLREINRKHQERKHRRLARVSLGGRDVDSKAVTPESGDVRPVLRHDGSIHRVLRHLESLPLERDHHESIEFVQRLLCLVMDLVVGTQQCCWKAVAVCSVFETADSLGLVSRMSWFCFTYACYIDGLTCPLCSFSRQAYGGVLTCSPQSAK